MEELIPELNKLTDGFPWFATFLIIMTIIFFIFFGKVLNSKIKKSDFFIGRGFRLFKKKPKLNTLIEHDLFATVNRVRNAIKYIEFTTDGEIDKVKSKMFIDFMSFKLDSIEKQFKKHLINISDDDSIDAIKNDLFELITNVISEYINKTERHFLKKGVTPEDTTYVIMLFEKWREETVSSASHRINSIFASTYYPTKFEKVLGSLEVFSMAVDLIPKDGVSSFNEMNGKFKDLKYD